MRSSSPIAEKTKRKGKKKEKFIADSGYPIQGNTTDMGFTS